MKKMSIRLHVNENGKLQPIFKMLEINRLEKKSLFITDHEYIDLLFKKCIENEEYEKCDRLLKLKSKLPQSNKKRHRNI